MCLARFIFIFQSRFFENITISNVYMGDIRQFSITIFLRQEAMRMLAAEVRRRVEEAREKRGTRHFTGGPGFRSFLWQSTGNEKWDADQHTNIISVHIYIYIYIYILCTDISGLTSKVIENDRNINYP